MIFEKFIAIFYLFTYNYKFYVSNYYYKILIMNETFTGESEADLLNSDVKSPVSLVHELALKRNLNVTFSVKSERGPPHMRVSTYSFLF